MGVEKELTTPAPIPLLGTRKIDQNTEVSVVAPTTISQVMTFKGWVYGGSGIEGGVKRETGTSEKEI